MRSSVQFLKITATLAVAFVILQTGLNACSMVKITLNGKTIIGNNEDFSNPDTRIWFEQGSGNKYGAVYVGYNNLFPEGGINEAGLVFDAFGMTNKPLKDTTGKLPIFELDLKRKIMQECSTVEEVNELISKYNLYFWSHSVWVFIDKAGRYLVVDGDSRTIGNNVYFVQTNFRQSEINDEKDITCERYLKAMSLLKSRCEVSTDYCKTLMDTVHTERTLYTTVYDLNAGTIELYYFHDYSKVVKFNINEELKKGNRVLSIPELFPEVTNPAHTGMIRFKSRLDSLAFHFTASDSSQRVTIINDLKKRDYTIHIMENYGYEYLHLGEIQKAIGIFNLVIEVYPEMPHGYHFLGEAYMENKQYKLALTNYMRSVELYPNDIDGKQRIKVLKELLKI